MHRPLFLGYKTVHHVSAPSTVGNCNTMINIIILRYNVIMSWDNRPICGLLLTVMSLCGA